MTHPKIPDGFEQIRKDFELELVLDAVQLDLDIRLGMLLRHQNSDGSLEHYRKPQVEAAWQGFKAGVQSNEALLGRYNQDRYVAPGMRTDLRERLDFLEEMSDANVDKLFKHILRIAGDTPNC